MKRGVCLFINVVKLVGFKSLSDRQVIPQHLLSQHSWLCLFKQNFVNAVIGRNLKLCGYQVKLLLGLQHNSGNIFKLEVSYYSIYTFHLSLVLGTVILD